VTLEGLVVSLILASLAIGIVALPFLRRAGGVARHDTDAAMQRDRIMAYYERVLQNIHDLDEDHALGKITDDDHARDREFWAQRGAQALKLLDTLETQPLAGSTTGDLDDAIERMVARARGDAS
jgi:hypothetical protein